MIRKAKAVWRGTGKDGNGDLSTDSQVLARTPYSFRTRFENEKGTNPEELLAAAHAGCFTMALAFIADGWLQPDRADDGGSRHSGVGWGAGFQDQPFGFDAAGPNPRNQRREVLRHRPRG